MRRRGFIVREEEDLLQYVKLRIARCQYLNETKTQDLTQITVKRLFKLNLKLSCFQNKTGSLLKSLLACAIEIA